MNERIQSNITTQSVVIAVSAVIGEVLSVISLITALLAIQDHGYDSAWAKLLVITLHGYVIYAHALFAKWCQDENKNTYILIHISIMSVLIVLATVFGFMSVILAILFFATFGICSTGLWRKK